MFFIFQFPNQSVDLFSELSECNSGNKYWQDKSCQRNVIHHHIQHHPPFIHSFHCLSLEGFHNPSFSEGPAAYRFLVAPRLLRDSFRLSDLQSRDKGNVASRQQLYVSRTISSVQNHHILSTAFIHFVYNFLRKFILSLWCLTPSSGRCCSKPLWMLSEGRLPSRSPSSKSFRLACRHRRTSRRPPYSPATGSF